MNREGTFAYACPFPTVFPTWYGPAPTWPPQPVEPVQPWVPTPAVTLWPEGLSPEDRALLQRIEKKLDELLRRTAPEAKQVEEIRRRVREALGEKT